jgi:hypothetical protein
LLSKVDEKVVGIMRYMQTNFSWVIDEESSLMLMRDALLYEYVPPDTVGKRLTIFGIPRSRVVNAYMQTLY